jgi:hypothetical protein
VPVSVTADRMFDINLPMAQDLVHIQGWIYDNDGHPVSSMKVAAWLDGHVVSTTATSDTSGGFDIIMPRGSATYTVRADATMDLVVPSVQLDVPAIATSPAPRPTLRLPKFGAPIAIPMDVSARSSSGIRPGVPGAAVTFTATISDPDQTAATFTRTGSTDSNGGLDITLIPGLSYTIGVKTPPTSEYASAVVENVSVGASTLEIELGQKTPVAGTLLGEDGKAVAGAVIQALGVGAAESAISNSSPNAATSVQTDMQGRYRILLDPGNYDLEVAPQDGSSYPRWGLESVAVGPGMVQADIQLPPASRIVGRVSGPDGMTQDADVRVYLVSQTGDGRLRGLAHTADDGSFELVLANPQLPTR